MKYMVFTTKHHDGFCMFDSQFSPYTAANPACPNSESPHPDLTKSIFNAFRAQGLWIGAYFSKPDWHHPDYWDPQFPPYDRNPNYDLQKKPEKWESFVRFTHNQILELMTNYGKVDILWLDGGWVQPYTATSPKWGYKPVDQNIRMDELAAQARQLQPGLIVVDRAVEGPNQNYLTPEQSIPDKPLPYPWETCMTMGNSWSYVPNDQYKPANELIEKLVDIVSKGGNYLLNIGPSPDGDFDPTAYDRLKEIGTWINTNGEGIYGSRMNKTFNEGESIRFTKSKDGQTQYAFLFEFPSGGIQAISKIDIPEKATIQLLGSDKKLKWKRTTNGVEVTIPPTLQNLSNHVWTLKIAAPSVK
jgi:alpha-L-fucosidase